MVILPENAHLHHAKAKVEDVVYGAIADDVEDEEGKMPVPKDQLMPRLSRWS